MHVVLKNILLSVSFHETVAAEIRVTVLHMRCVHCYPCPSGVLLFGLRLMMASGSKML